MIITVGLRAGPNKTNMRSEALSRALGDAGHKVTHQLRSTPATGDLYIQTGFARSTGLVSAIEAQIPYIIMEAPVFRSFDLATHSSWAYNGLQGGGWHPPSPTEDRPKPVLMESHGGGQLIIGQKPTDHSLRGSDHVSWILEKRLALPEADFRPHPLMVPAGSLDPIEVALRDYGEVFTYSSTVGVDALCAGGDAYADSGDSLLRSFDGDREDFIHRLSWWQALHTEYPRIREHVLSGYEEARDRMRNGLCEHPRGRVDGQAICERYYRAGL